MDLLIDCHCHLIRATRSLIPWGTTLHVAVVHLSALATSEIAAALDRLSVAALFGDEEHHVGAPHHLVQVASSISARIGEAGIPSVPVPLGMVYLLALQCLLRADAAHLAAVYDQMRSGSEPRQAFDE
jgi:hypothetical protein